MIELSIVIVCFVLINVQLFHAIAGLVCSGVVPVLEDPEQLDLVSELCDSEYHKALHLLVQLCEKPTSINKGENKLENFLK